MLYRLCYCESFLDIIWDRSDKIRSQNIYMRSVLPHAWLTLASRHKNKIQTYMSSREEAYVVSQLQYPCQPLLVWFSKTFAQTLIDPFFFINIIGQSLCTDPVTNSDSPSLDKL